MKKLNILISVLFIMIFTNLKSQNVIIDGELRPRAEFRDGYKNMPSNNDTAAYFISQRTRLNFAYKKDKLSTKISLQDVRVWGDKDISKNVGSLDIHEAFAQLDLSKSIALKIGRQEIFYDDERLFGRINWQQAGMKHDALIFKYFNDSLKMKLDIGFAFNQEKENEFGTNYSSTVVGNNYKTLNYAYFSKSFGNIQFSLLDIFDGFQSTKNSKTLYLRGTSGAIVEANTDAFYLHASGFYQYGKEKDGTNINAYYLNLDLSKNFLNKKLNTLIGFEYLSGNDNTDKENKDQNTFSTLYGTGHKMNGNMDYFTNFVNDTKKSGLVNPYIFITYKATPKFSIRMDYHYFALQNKYLKPTTNETIDKYLGSEFDLSAKYKIMDEVDLELGYSTMFGTESLEIIKGGKKDILAQWGWIMLTIKPKFYKN